MASAAGDPRSGSPVRQSEKDDNKDDDKDGQRRSGADWRAGSPVHLSDDEKDKGINKDDDKDEQRRARSRSPRGGGGWGGGLPVLGKWKELKTGNWKFTFRCPTLKELSAFDKGCAALYHSLNWQLISRRSFANGVVKDGTPAGKLAVRFIKETGLGDPCSNSVYVTARHSRIEMVRIKFEQDDDVGTWIARPPEDGIPPIQKKPHNRITIQKPKNPLPSSSASSSSSSSSSSSASL